MKNGRWRVVKGIMYQPSNECQAGEDQLVINGSSVHVASTKEETCIDHKKPYNHEYKILRKRPKSYKDGSKKIDPYNITAHKKAKTGSVENNDVEYQCFLAAQTDKNEINLSKLCPEKTQKPSYEKGCVVYNSEEGLNHLLRDLTLGDPPIEEYGVIIDNCKKMITISSTSSYKKYVDYREEKELGRGGSGVVNLVTDFTSGKKFVSKSIKRSLFDVKEAQVMTQLKHENITGFFGIKVNKTEIQIFQEYAGASFFNLKAHKWSEDDIIDLSIQALDGLSFMHKFELIHMDLKPDNICVQLETKHLYLTDFGSCKTPQHAITGKGLTPEYMSPELCKHVLNQLIPNYFPPKEITGKNDVYAWGLTAGFMIEGEHVMMKHMNTSSIEAFQESRRTYPLWIAKNPCFMQSNVPEKLNDDLKKVIKNCLAGDANDRVTALEGKKQFTDLKENRDRLRFKPGLLENRKMIKGKLYEKLTKKKGPIPEALEDESPNNYEPMAVGNDTGASLNCPDFGILLSD